MSVRLEIARSLRRRRVVYGLSAAAVTAGIGIGIWREREQGAADAAGLWGMRFERPDGGDLSMAGLRGRPVVLNFWASWCAPCVREMPELDRFHRSAYLRGGQVVGLAIDTAKQVREFLKHTPVSFPIGVAGVGGTDAMRRLGNAQGGLPFTVLFDSEGAPLRTHLGETNYQTLVEWTAGI